MRNGHQGGSVIRLVEPVGDGSGDGRNHPSLAPDRTGASPPDAVPPNGLLDLALGAAGLGVAAAVAILREVTGGTGGAGGAAGAGEQDQGAEQEDVAALLGVVGMAGLGLAAEAGSRAVHAFGSAVAAVRPIAELAAARTPLGRPMRAAAGWLDGWSARGRSDQRAREAVAGRFLEAVVPRVAAAVIERVDLDAAVTRVDLDAAVSRVDIGAIVDRVDIGAIVDRLDIDAIVAGVDVGAIVERIDIDAIVARVDIDAIAARVDVQAIVDRLDLPTLTRTVMDEVDVGEIIRESTGSIGTETVDAIRYQGMNADRLVQRIVDRIMLRRSGRELTLPPPSVDAGDAPDGAEAASPGARA
jgi:hypothetical protein